jgi:hypothetical protein
MLDAGCWGLIYIGTVNIGTLFYHEDAKKAKKVLLIRGFAPFALFVSSR